MEENVTYDSDNEIFPYSEDNTDEDYLIPRANDKKWILRVVNGEPAKLGDIPYQYLDDPFIYNKYVGPIPIAIKNQDYKNACLVSGYGKTGRDKKISSDVLLKAYLTIMSSENCSELYQYNMETFICTVTQVPDVGRGDSGGPLVCSNTSDPNEGDSGVLVGIVRSYSPNRSSLFVRVSQYYDFITKESTQFIENSDYGALHSMCNVYQPNFYFLFILELIFFKYYSEVFQCT
ncbi:hypothetical protein HF086_004816 [Spodoptera exigua]|uniref:Peptidase S1 domain-containing protein n=1 Tax=Spodoptera exigua TaxID=7107 RepID=A0A922SAA5_SPOEX|nr:hypothetical protein HF086_004816 [Spodoptera exigua]